MAAYFLFATGSDAKKVGVFAAIGILVGAVLLISDRLTTLKVGGFGELTAVVQQAEGDLEQIQQIRKTVQDQSDQLSLMVRESEHARKDLRELEDLSKSAKAKVDDVARIQEQAQLALDELRAITNFNMLIAAAMSDNRPALDELLKIAREDNNPLSQLALRAAMEVASGPTLIDILKPVPKWKDEPFDPETASFDQLRNAYDDFKPILKPAVLNALWINKHISLFQKLSFLVDVMKTTDSIRVLHMTCILVNKEAALGLNALVYDRYLEWWEENKDRYPEHEPQ
jgi:hypothetical protein